MTTVIALFLVFIVGGLFMFLARLRQPIDLFAGTSFLAGSIVITLAMLVLSSFGVSWLPATILVLSFVFASSGMVVRLMSSSGISREPQRFRLELPDFLLAAIVLLHAFYVTETGPRDLDYWVIWGLKAKVFFEAGGTIDWSFLRDASNSFAHPDYPPLLTFMYGWLASWKEVWSDRWFGLLETGMVASLLVIVRGQVGSMTRSPRIGSWTALLLAFPVLQVRYGIADVPLFAFVTAGLLYLQAALRRGGQTAALVGFLLLGGAALTKNEGVSWLVVAIVVYGFASRDLRRTILMALPGIAVAAAWQAPRLIFGLSADVAAPGKLGRMGERLVDLGWTGNLVAFAPPELTAAIIATIIALFVARARLKSFSLLFAASGAQLFVYLAIYTVTPYPPAWHVATSWDRISLHLAIPTLVGAVTALTERVSGASAPSGCGVSRKSLEMGASL
ncbi:MAG: hypothetical protein R3338_06520 [Thermoanaerobaculia bacterium]|nr:hypothetical protein [Thermoanaerobaculia bacterium]